jgi:hypothetical protein
MGRCPCAALPSVYRTGALALSPVVLKVRSKAGAGLPGTKEVVKLAPTLTLHRLRKTHAG